MNQIRWQVLPKTIKAVTFVLNLAIIDICKIVMEPNILCDVSAVILSSGLSERMGKPKALLKWSTHCTFIEKIIDEFHGFGCRQIICMINSVTEPLCNTFDVPRNVMFIVNHHPEWGRFYSIKTGLSNVMDLDFCFIHNVDNPFVNGEIIAKLYARRSHKEWCSPVYNGKGGHPVLINRSISKRILGIQDLNTPLANVLSLYPRANVEMHDDLIHRNINTPEDYRKFVGLG